MATIDDFGGDGQSLASLGGPTGWAAAVRDALTALRAYATGVVTNAQADSYTLVLADAGKLVELGKATAQNLTVPSNSSVAFDVGTRIDVLQTGAGQVTVVPGDGAVVINAKTGFKLSGQWAGATLIKRGPDMWVLIGSLSA
jgi:hypothetical protein